MVVVVPCPSLPLRLNAASGLKSPINHSYTLNMRTHAHAHISYIRYLHHSHLAIDTDPTPLSSLLQRFGIPSSLSHDHSLPPHPILRRRASSL